MRSLYLSKLEGKKSTIISSEEALKDIEIINWSKDVLSGLKKVLVKFDNETYNEILWKKAVENAKRNSGGLTIYFEDFDKI